MGRRSRQRERGAAGGGAQKAGAPASEYGDAEGNLLVLRASLSLAARRRYSETLAGGWHQEDAQQRASELLFELLAIAWTISGVGLNRQKELLGRYRMASAAERQFVLAALREHVAEHFPELKVP
ncbi:MAG: hypothetical protein ACYC91_03790 [Solirubrobacteraceae bacterium]